MRIGLICDVHEDFQSLKVALRQLERRNCSDLICLGDVIGFDGSFHEHGLTRDSSACIAAIRGNCRYAVVGNHDLFALKKIPQSNHAFTFPSDWYELSLRERRELSNDRVWLYETESTTTRLNRSEREYLESLPEYLILKFNNRTVHFSHSLHPDLTGSLMLRPHNPWELREHFQILRNSGCSCGFSGHMHPNGILIAGENDMRESAFGRIKLEQHLTQYSCPGIADGRGRRGYTIVDCAAMTIETFKLSGHSSWWKKLYERVIKKR